RDQGARPHVAHTHARRRVPGAHREPLRRRRHRQHRGGPVVTAANVTFELRPNNSPGVVRARPAGAFHDVIAIAGRALRAVPRDSEVIIPPIFIAIFFYVVNVATLQNITQASIPGFDYKAFQMATAVLLGVTGVSRAQALVVDVQNGYFD